MWSTIANFKDNLTQIASDVLDSADELDGDGSPHAEDDGSFDSVRTTPQRVNDDSYKDSNLKAELEWFRGEVSRLQAAETEIQQLSMNYVALLKEREEEVSRLREENEVLKKKLVVSSSHDGSHVLENDGRNRQLEDTVKKLEAQLQASNTRHQEQLAALKKDHEQQLEALTMQQKKDHSASQSEQARSNGLVPAVDPQLQKLKSELQKLQATEKRLKAQLSEKDESLEKLKTVETTSSSEIRRLEELLLQEKETVSNLNLQLQRDHEASETALRSSETLQLELRKVTEDMAELQRRLDEPESLRLTAVEERKVAVADLETKNSDLLEERNRLLKELEILRQGSTEKISKDLVATDTGGSPEASTEIVRLTEQLEGAEKKWSSAKSEYEAQIEKARVERDKAKRDLARLKQHLLDKELADSEKMDQDSEQIADLQARAESNFARALHAEQALSQALSELSESRRQAKEEARRTSEEIEALQRKLSSCISAIESKDIELSNLQSALGQYYAESEAQERLYVELSASRDEIASLTQQLQAANQKIEVKNAEKDAALDKLVAAEQRKFETVQKMRKLEDEIMRLRKALEQSMTRLNTLSSDSDYHVDRRIVIKLLVTYFQRNHSREVLDLMVRMLGFSEEDKRRVGLAQQNAGRGVVRGVLGLPGRFVGGLIGSASADSLALRTPPENQSFADLWIDFLLKESEERERREKAEADAKAEGENGVNSPNAAMPSNSTGSGYSGPHGYVPGSSAKGSVSTPPSPERPVGHRPSNSFSGFSFSSPNGPSYRTEISSVGSANGPVLGSEQSDIGNEFSSISLTPSSAPSDSFSIRHPDTKLPPRS
ncbi:hypothetical protein R1sor_023771 [Riccia sorocarpa]|uniref:Golgin candidate 4 n=1 Tax=Riccia sorocarpa TaxID=122646 RepID=A0ABD3GRW3_9MARC